MQSLNVIVVHCSDGVVRSGTYVLIDMVLNRLSKGCKDIWNLYNIIFVNSAYFHLTNFLFDNCALHCSNGVAADVLIGLAQLDFTRKIARRLRAQTDTTETIALMLCNGLSQGNLIYFPGWADTFAVTAQESAQPIAQHEKDFNGNRKSSRLR